MTRAEARVTRAEATGTSSAEAPGMPRGEAAGMAPAEAPGVMPAEALDVSFAEAPACVSAPVACAHCALPVPPGPIDATADRQFCCQGCRAVWDLIHDRGLERYYALRVDGAAPAA